MNKKNNHFGVCATHNIFNAKQTIDIAARIIGKLGKTVLLSSILIFIWSCSKGGSMPENSLDDQASETYKDSLFIKDNTIEKWGMFELKLFGPSTGTPAYNVSLSAVFSNGETEKKVIGFYNGNGEYLVRFMPNKTGIWNFVTSSGIPNMNNRKGNFTSIPASSGNHGPVSVSGIQFDYGDGKLFLPFGTTAYCWELEPRYEQTLETLKKSGFNKVRFMPFPHKDNSMPIPPFLGTNGNWNFESPNPEFWKFFDKSVTDLQKLGIEAEIILFHPYDRNTFGFDKMTHEQASFYIKYISARLSAYRNVWWSMANEYDLIKDRTLDQWENLGSVLKEADPYNHPKSIHALPGKLYPKSDSNWITHISYQGYDPENIASMILKYQKPVFLDEFGYEGNLSNDWGNLSAKECTRRCWVTVVNGGYFTHGESYASNNDNEGLFFWKGGNFMGESHKRIDYLQNMLDKRLTEPLVNVDKYTARAGDNFILSYLGDSALNKFEMDLATGNYNIEIIDPWEMTVISTMTSNGGKVSINLPSKNYLAITATKF